MTTVIEVNEGSAKTNDQSKCRVHTKGASEIVLAACTQYIDENGNVHKLDKAATTSFEGVINQYAEKALRTITLAYKDITDAQLKKVSDDEPPLTNLVLIGIVGIMDPLRPGVVESVQAFRNAGVFVRMITGDNITTAKAIARNAGIFTKGGVALTGPEFRQLSREEQMKIVPRLQVLARSSPTDKTIVVDCLQKQDQVVGMTGDGTNDGPALKMADVGFSMGIAGTEVAKEASDIILMDDNFNSILKALKWGRAVNDGVRKFLTFQLTVNIAAVALSFISAVTSDNSESVLSAVQLLWVNLIMDTLAALALATEPPTDDLLKRKPISRNAHLINYRMSKLIVGEAIFQIILNLVLIAYGAKIFNLGDSQYDQAVLRTLVFNTFVFLQVFNEINCRRIDDTLNVFKDLFNNWIFIAVQVVVIVCQFLIVTFGGIAFKTVPLSPLQWLTTIAIGMLSIPLGTLIRLLPDFGHNGDSEDAKPLATYSRMNWEGAIGDVKSELRVFTALRKGRSHSMHKRSNTASSLGAPGNIPDHTNYGSTSAGSPPSGNRFADLVTKAKAMQQAAAEAEARQREQ
jgi:calcium-translocating P-type ATPase